VHDLLHSLYGLFMSTAALECMSDFTVETCCCHFHRVYYGEGVPDELLGILRAFNTELVKVDLKQVGRL
jgi:hypothetical protein